MQTIVLEIRNAEGGEDSKLLVSDMADIYIRSAIKKNFEVKTIHWRDGFVSLWIRGKNSKNYFLRESGNHRWQRVPPTEKRGRMQTSSVTVVVMDDTDYKNIEIHESEVRSEYTRGTGNGGQHKNVTDSCVVLTHYSTGIKVRVDGRSQHKNKAEAWVELTRRVNNYYHTGKIEEDKEIRRDQIGKGNRGDKRRTYRVQDGYVIDHITGKRAKLKSILRGNLELLH